jgi:hypothetical protein
MTTNRTTTTFHKYLKKKLQHHEDIIAIIEHGDEYFQIQKHRIQRDVLIDIIQHFEEFVKDEMENS